MAPGVPLLFQGEEWAASTPFQYFTAHDDPELGRAVSEGRKREFAAFGWAPDDVPDPQDPATFQRSKLQWDEVSVTPHREMLAWYRSLIALRRAIPSLTDGDLRSVRIDFNEGERWLTMSRGEVTVALNIGESEQSLPVPDGLGLKLASETAITHSNGYVTLPPRSTAVLIGHR
jgi:maltooligosyltrehalose trehalohydrolase